THSEPIPNSAVKHFSGNDTCGVAHWDNSSMPGLIFPQSHSFFSKGWLWLFLFFSFSLFLSSS
ncbi:MAG: hypothetical protein WBM32_05365, partial [Crocosphaera sp.]